MQFSILFFFVSHITENPVTTIAAMSLDPVKSSMKGRVVRTLFPSSLLISQPSNLNLAAFTLF